MSRSAPVNVYIAYSKADAPLMERLRLQLNAIERIGLLDTWHDGEVEVGTDWESAMLKALHESEIILLLISADYLASEFAFEKEIKSALDLQQKGKAKVLPVILRACPWEYTELAKLKVLPSNKIPVTDTYWKNTDNAFRLVVDEVVKSINGLKKQAAEDHPQPISMTPPVIKNPREVPPSDSLTMAPPPLSKEQLQKYASGKSGPSEKNQQTDFKTVRLHGQVWTAEDISMPIDEGSWVNEQGQRFYNFEAAQKVCPPGWRLPNREDWKALQPFHLEQLHLSFAGVIDRGHPRDHGKKAYYWTGERAAGGEAWCFETRTVAASRLERRYTHWGFPCRFIQK